MTSQTSSYIVSAEDILSRDAYLAAYKSENGMAFTQYREHVLTSLLRPYEHRLFPTQLAALRGRFEVSLQELVNATPQDTYILDREYDDDSQSLEEKRKLVQRMHFENTFEKVKENVQMSQELIKRTSRI